MRNGRRIAIRIGGGLAGLVVVLGLIGVILLRTEIGHRLTARIVDLVTDGEVRIEGLAGDLPYHVRAEQVEIADAKGVWLRVRDVSLDWNPWSLLDGPIAVGDLRAANVTVLRRPESQSSSESETAVAVAHLAVARLELSAALAGHAVALRAEGRADYRDRRNAAADIVLTQIGGDGRYEIHGTISDGRIAGNAHIAETGRGVLGALAGLENLGPIALDAVAGESGNANRIAVVLGAGELIATGNGTIDLDKARADLALDVHAPAMNPGADLAWKDLSLRGRMHGTFDAPQIDANLRIDGLTAGEISVAAVNGILRGSGGTGDFNLSLEQIALPGLAPDLLAPDLLERQAVIFAGHVDFASASRPIDFAIIHPLLRANGHIETGGALSGQLNIVLPLLAPLTKAAGVALDGEAKAQITLSKAQNGFTVTLNGDIDAEPQDLLGRMIGHKARLGGRVLLNDGALGALHAEIALAALTASLDGSGSAEAMDFRYAADLTDVSILAPSLGGTASLSGTLTGRSSDARLAGLMHGMLSIGGAARERVDASFHIEGLPKPKSGAITLRGRFGGSAVTAMASLAPAGGGLRGVLDTLQWKSLRAKASLDLAADGSLRSGQASVHWDRLEDAAALAGTSLGGALDARIELAAGATIDARASKLRIGDIGLGQLTVAGTIAEPLSHPVMALTAAATAIETGAIQGDANFHIAGPANRTALRASFEGTAQSRPLQISTEAQADLSGRRLTLGSLQGQWNGASFALMQPAQFDLNKGVSVDRLELRAADTRLTIAGRITPVLALTIAVDGMGSQTLQAAGIPADGTISGHAQLSGTVAAPAGNFAFEGRDLGIGGPRAQLDLHGTLAAGHARIDATLSSGQAANLRVMGTVPLSSDGLFDLQARGAADLALLSTYTAATGQTVGGNVALDMRLAGTIDAPRLSGHAGLSNGSLNDFAHSFRLRAISAEVVADGTLLRVTSLSAKARHGSFTGSGTIDLGAPGMPIDIAIKADDAQPITSDRITARFDADLTLSGKLRTLTTLSGRVTVNSGEIDLPKRLAAEVPTLNVRRRGEMPAPAQPATVMALDVSLDVPDHISLRGRGLESELAGSLKISGTTGAPAVLGNLTMRRGTLSVAGHTLDIQSGAIGFNGSSLRSRIDPTLDFTAQTTSGGVTATLKITGYASQPVIVLTSSPELPQDEILAQLLFQTSVKQLSPIQIAELAQAIPSLTGIGEGFDPVDSLRRSLGLDRLAVGSASEASGGGTTVEVGRNVAPGLYVGARQNLSGGTRAVVQYDLTKNLKLEATVNTGTAATAAPSTTTQDNGSSVGITYQFDY